MASDLRKVGVLVYSAIEELVFEIAHSSSSFSLFVDKLRHEHTGYSLNL